MNTFFDKAKTFAPAVLRVGLSLVFLWFGSEQLLNTSMWTGLVPDSAVSLTGFTATTLVLLNGAFEVVFGVCLLLGYFTRVTAFLLALHMLQIAFLVGYNEIGVRDFGLSMGAIALFLYGRDAMSLDAYLAKKREM